MNDGKELDLSHVLLSGLFELLEGFASWIKVANDTGALILQIVEFLHVFVVVDDRQGVVRDLQTAKCLQNVCKCLQNVCQMFAKCLQNVGMQNRFIVRRLWLATVVKRIVD